MCSRGFGCCGSWKHHPHPHAPTPAFPSPSGPLLTALPHLQSQWHPPNWGPESLLQVTPHWAPDFISESMYQNRVSSALTERRGGGCQHGQPHPPFIHTHQLGCLPSAMPTSTCSAGPASARSLAGVFGASPLS